MNNFRNIHWKQISFWIVGIIVLLNLIIFIKANTFPIHWVQNETLLHRFFWSMDGADDFHLHSGLKLADLIKPFNCYYNDGIFRTRQLSYFLEMVSFKLWQYFQVGFFRNYSLIFLHIINVFLFSWLIFLLTKKKISAVLAGLMVLNAGMALSTLLFPFRNAKLLVVTFFLMAWIIITASPRKFFESSRRRLICFFLIILALLFTDEIAFFLIPFLLVYIGIQDGRRGVLNHRIGLWAAVGAGTFLLILGFCFFLYLHVTPEKMQVFKHGKYFGNLMAYWVNPRTYWDVGQSFLGSFLSRNFGYWDKSFWGATAFLASLSLLVLAAPFKTGSFYKKIILSLLVLLVVKTFCLPHDSGEHPVFMPKGTVFPSLLFFDFYYSYLEIFIITAIFSLFLVEKMSSPARDILIFLCVSVISFSNAVHLRNGPSKALEFHEWSLPERQQVVKNIESAERLFKKYPGPGPAYLSFPTGNTDILKGRIDDGDQMIYSRIVPIMFVRSVEEGRAVMSLQNFKYPQPFVIGEELAESSLFIDFGFGESYDLNKIKNSYGVEKLKPASIPVKMIGKKTQKIVGQNIEEVVFFIKGEAEYVLDINGKYFKGQQVYGQSYQMFKFTNQAENTDPELVLNLNILGKSLDVPVQLVGPFVFTKEGKKAIN